MGGATDRWTTNSVTTMVPTNFRRYPIKHPQIVSMISGGSPSPRAADLSPALTRRPITGCTQWLGRNIIDAGRQRLGEVHPDA